MEESTDVRRRRQFCARCGRLMFEYFSSPDGHFGLAGEKDDPSPGLGQPQDTVRCPTCGALYRLLDRVNGMGQAVERA